MSGGFARSGRTALHWALLAGTALFSLPVAAEETRWTDSGADWATPENWDNGVPGSGDTAIFRLGASEAFLASYVAIDAAEAVGLLQFDAGAGYYWISIGSGGALELGGIANDSPVEQVIMNSGLLTMTGGTISGIVTLDGPGDITFTGEASAGSALIKRTGGTLTFSDQSSGGTAEIEVAAGTVIFEDQSDAGAAVITLSEAGSSVSFEDDASAGSAEITSSWGMILFSGDADAGTATLKNDASRFGARTITFSDTSSAGEATIYSGTSGNGSSSVNFTEDSSAGTARLIAEAGGRITFSDNADGADAAFVLQGGTIGIDMSWDDGDFTAGSIEGTGTIEIRDKGFLVGSNNQSTSFAGVISGTSGSFGKTGTGTLTLTGSSHSYSGLTTVMQGGLVVEGSLLNSAGIVVFADGWLGGSGVLPTVGINGGTLAPGSSIGELEISGDLEFSTGSTYEVEVDAAGNADRTVVSGTAALDGTVRVLAEDGSYAASTDYTIVSAGTIVGSFAAVTSDLAFLTPTLSTVGSDVILTLTRNSVALPGVADTPNQAATAEAVEALGSGQAVFDAVTGLSADGARAGYDALSGEVHASLAGLLISDDTVRRALQQRAMGEADGTGAFFLSEGAHGAAASDGNAAAAGRFDGEVIAGADAGRENGRLGVLVHAGAGATTIPDRDSTATDASYGAGVFGGLGGDGLRLGFGASYSLYDIETEREVAVGSIADVLRARYGASRMQGFAELGYRLGLGTGSVTPFLNLAQVRLASGSFVESGGEAALSGEASMVDATFATLGMRAEGQFDLDGRPVALRGMAGWRRSIMETPQAELAFAGSPDFIIAGPAMAGDALVLEGGLDMTLSDGVALGLGYDGQLSATAQNHALKASLLGQF